jgi:arylsulfatase A-like enzyme
MEMEMEMKVKRNNLMKVLLNRCGLVLLALLALTAPALAKDKPNILVIMTDDVGVWNVSAYHRGMMGGSTPNIDRIAKEGALFTDYYSQQSCTAGRAAFILGQTPFRTGLSKVGMPAAKQGLQDSDPTIAELLKPHGYATAQIGKNHLGAHRAWLRRVLRHSLSSQRHGRAVRRRLPEGSCFPREVRSSQHHSHESHQQGRLHDRSALGPRRQADNQ